MRHRIAKVDQETITEQLGDMPIVALDHGGTHPLIGPHHVPPVFRVEVRGELRRVHQVAEHHGELAAFSVRRGRDDGCGLALRWGGLRRGRQRHWRGGGGCAGRPTRPDEHTALFIHGQLFGVNEVVFERFQQVIIDLEAQFQDPIGKTLLPLEESQGLGDDGIIVHYRPSICASAASVWGSQNVISMARYSAMAVDSAVRACSVWPAVAYSMLRPRWQWAWS